MQDTQELENENPDAVPEQPPAVLSEEDELVILERLRKLGYVE